MKLYFKQKVTKLATIQSVYFTIKIYRKFKQLILLLFIYLQTDTL